MENGRVKPFTGSFDKLIWYGRTFRDGDILTKMSYLIMGLSNICRGQIVKGFSYLMLEISFIVYFIEKGLANLTGLGTLGTHQQQKVYNDAKGIYEFIKGDNSMLMLLSGLSTVVIIIFFIILWSANLKSAIASQQAKIETGKNPGIIDDIRSLFDSNLHKALLAIPVAGLIINTVLPLVYMILVAFTSYDRTHQPPGKLFTWVGLDNFKTLLLSSDKLAYTFWHMLGWTIIWAIFSTFLNYLLGVMLAIQINSKGIRYKAVWRTIFVLSTAVPSFVTLYVLRIMLQDQGAVNVLLQELGFITSKLPFLTDPSWARVTVIVVNLWIGIPYTMLMSTGILMNIPQELYESARIDGAGPAKSFFHITMPYMLFVTTPYLISNFVFNINNFNAIYFLTQGGPATLEYFNGAGKTDLLVTWLYTLTSRSRDYCYASVIGMLIFILSAGVSLLTLRKTGSYMREEGFQQ